MQADPDSELMRIFDFTADDLEANRAGRLSEMQKSILIKGIGDQRRLIKKSIIRFPLIGFLFCLVYFSPDNIQHWLSASAMLIVELFLTAILFSIFVY